MVAQDLEFRLRLHHRELDGAVRRSLCEGDEHVIDGKFVVHHKFGYFEEVLVGKAVKSERLICIRDH